MSSLSHFYSARHRSSAFNVLIGPMRPEGSWVTQHLLKVEEEEAEVKSESRVSFSRSNLLNDRSHTNSMTLREQEVVGSHDNMRLFIFTSMRFLICAD